MLVNADFSRHAVVAPHQYHWVASPQIGVERVMLDRVGAEKARATSIVRYAPDSSFPRHLHPGGEEILVLSGSFSEGDVHYPAGWYLRSPPGSSHQPSSEGGATLFVKLQQMPEHEQRHVRIDTRDAAAWHRQGGSDICSLYSDQREQVSLRRLGPHEHLSAEHGAGAELLVLDGEIVSDDRAFAAGTWMRLPAGAPLAITAGLQGATLYLKTGHLADMVVDG